MSQSVNIERIDRTCLRILEQEVANINSHLPKRQISLADLLSERRPSVTTRDGSEIHLSVGELRDLASRVNTEDLSGILLPVVFWRKVGLGRGVLIVGGGNAEYRLVRQILGTREEKDGETESRHFFWYDVAAFRRRYRTLSTIGFTT